MGLGALSWGQPASSLPPPPPSVAGDQGPMERLHGHGRATVGPGHSLNVSVALPYRVHLQCTFPPAPGHLLFRSVYLPAYSTRAALDTGVRLARGSPFPGCRWGLRGGVVGPPCSGPLPRAALCYPRGVVMLLRIASLLGPGMPVPLPARPHPQDESRRLRWQVGLVVRLDTGGLEGGVRASAASGVCTGLMRQWEFPSSRRHSWDVSQAGPGLTRHLREDLTPSPAGSRRRASPPVRPWPWPPGPWLPCAERTCLSAAPSVGGEPGGWTVVSDPLCVSQIHRAPVPQGSGGPMAPAQLSLLPDGGPISFVWHVQGGGGILSVTGRLAHRAAVGAEAPSLCPGSPVHPLHPAWGWRPARPILPWPPWADAPYPVRVGWGVTCSPSWFLGSTLLPQEPSPHAFPQQGGRACA